MAKLLVAGGALLMVLASGCGGAVDDDARQSVGAPTSGMPGGAASNTGSVATEPMHPPSGGVDFAYLGKNAAIIFDLGMQACEVERSPMMEAVLEFTEAPGPGQLTARVLSSGVPLLDELTVVDTDASDGFEVQERRFVERGCSILQDIHMWVDGSSPFFAVLDVTETKSDSCSSSNICLNRISAHFALTPSR